MRTCLLISLLSVITAVLCRPQEQHGSNLRPPEPPLRTHFRTDAEYRANKRPVLRDTMDILAKQLIETNSTDFTMDTRTPPRIKLQQKNAMKNKQPKPEKIEEISHPGVAVPVDVDTLMEVTTQKIEQKTSTDSGLSTWILLSGNSPSTKPARKVVSIKPTTNKPTSPQSTTPKFVTIVDKIPKTTQKSRTTTTKKPTTTPTVTTSVEPKLSNKVMTKIKASVLSSAMNNKTRTTILPSSTVVTSTSTTTTVSTTTATPTTVKEVTKNVVEVTKTTEENKEDNLLQPEAKIAEVELPESKMTTKRPTKRPPTVNNNNKRKKNKNRRRKPETSTKTSGTKVGQKEKPIGTQIYNYLSREVMPTVGVGLVGLVVTAGLASYFLFPFTGLRRNFEGATDRRDEHFYENYMADGELEQDVIGKMIEGGYEYPNQLSNSVYPPYDQFNGYDSSKITYNDRIVDERQKETGYTVDDRKSKQKYVVGSRPDQNFAPVTVPEHGPRSLRIRRNVQNVPKEEDNEITSIHRTKYTKYKETLKQKADAINENLNESTTEKNTNPTTSKPPVKPSREPNNFFSFFRNLFEMKVRLGLDFLVNTTESVSKYLRGVQTRVENVIHANHNRPHNNHNTNHNQNTNQNTSTENNGQTTSSTQNINTSNTENTPNTQKH